jgi:ATP-dependent RNA helicase HelY
MDDAPISPSLVPYSLWCEGASLDVTLSQADIAAGDFVRAIKQLIDLVAQIASATESAELRSTARKALDGLRRGVIEQSTAIG